jgi:hypothetical protein
VIMSMTLWNASFQRRRLGGRRNHVARFSTSRHFSRLNGRK